MTRTTLLIPAALLASLAWLGAQDAPKPDPKPAEAPKVEAKAAPKADPKSAPKAAPKPAAKAAPKGKAGKAGTSILPQPNMPLVPKASAPVPLPSKKKPVKLPYEKRVNLNAASREELMKVPTVDGPTADRIIANRPYKVTGELLVRNVVPGAHFWTVKDLVTAGPTLEKLAAAKAAKAPAKK